MPNACADPDDPKAQMRAQQQGPVLQGTALSSSMAQPQATMNIVVPSGLRPGDQWNINTPDGQQLTIRCPEGAVGGQTVAINYQPRNLGPGPTVIGAPVGIPAGGPAMGTLVHYPEYMDHVQQADQSSAQNAWLAYGIGWALCCCCGPIGPIFWFSIACMHYLKPKEQRDMMQAEKQVATVSCVTGLMCTVLAVIFLLLIMASPLEPEFKWNMIAVNQTCSDSEGFAFDTIEGEPSSVDHSDDKLKNLCQDRCAQQETCRFFEFHKAWDDYQAWPDYYMLWCNFREFCSEEGRSTITVEGSQKHIAEIWEKQVE